MYLDDILLKCTKSNVTIHIIWSPTMTIEFDDSKYTFVKCEPEEEGRAYFWFKPNGEELTPENKFLVILSYEVDADGDIEWGDFHSICAGEETYFTDEMDEDLLDAIYDTCLDNAPEEL